MLVFSCTIFFVGLQVSCSFTHRFTSRISEWWLWHKNDADAFSALKKLHANRVEWALVFTHGDNLSLIDFSKIKPDYVCVPFFEGIVEQMPDKIKKNTVIITGLKSDKDLLDLLRCGFSYFQGSVVNLILGASCQQNCPYGDTCTDGLCQRIWTGKINQNQCVFPDFRNRFILDEQEGA